MSVNGTYGQNTFIWFNNRPDTSDTNKFRDLNFFVTFAFTNSIWSNPFSVYLYLDPIQSKMFRIFSHVVYLGALFWLTYWGLTEKWKSYETWFMIQVMSEIAIKNGATMTDVAKAVTQQEIDALKLSAAMAAGRGTITIASIISFGLLVWLAWKQLVLLNLFTDSQTANTIYFVSNEGGGSVLHSAWALLIMSFPAAYFCIVLSEIWVYRANISGFVQVYNTAAKWIALGAEKMATAISGALK